MSFSKPTLTVIESSFIHVASATISRSLLSSSFGLIASTWRTR